MSGTTTSCANNSGTATATAAGGSIPYTYLWNNGATTSTITGLSAGSYTVTVTDAKGCTKNGTYIVIQGSSTTVTITPTNITCFGGSNGNAVAMPVGGGPFTYLWSNGKTTKKIWGLTVGAYTVTVTNSFGCTTTASVTIISPSKAITCITTTMNDQGGCTGTATTSITGGTAPYTLLWSNGATTSSVGNLCAGFYTVSITDANGCSCTALVKIDYAPPVMGGNQTNTLSTGSTNVSDVEVEELNVVAAPNPTIGLVNVSFVTKEATQYTLVVIDVNGKLVSSQSSASIEGQNVVPVDLSNFEKGVYMIRFTAGTATKTIRIVLQ
ncbi:MAG: T9SS type A sorting domain-containing protein [Bacteroidetes bacterium]|nr:T9SS type A sorting domain-containing protein [Bacteroidota bacterium]